MKIIRSSMDSFGRSFRVFILFELLPYQQFCVEPSRAMFPLLCRKSLINRHCVQRRQSKTWSIISGIRLQLAGLIVEHKLSNHTAGLRSVSYCFISLYPYGCYYSLGFSRIHTRARASTQLPRASVHISLIHKTLQRISESKTVIVATRETERRIYLWNNCARVQYIVRSNRTHPTVFGNRKK